MQSCWLLRPRGMGREGGPYSSLGGEHQHKQLVLPALLPLPRSVLSCGQQTTRSSFQAMALHRIS